MCMSVQCTVNVLRAGLTPQSGLTELGSRHTVVCRHILLRRVFENQLIKLCICFQEETSGDKTRLPNFFELVSSSSTSIACFRFKHREPEGRILLN